MFRLSCAATLVFIFNFNPVKSSSGYGIPRPGQAAM